VMKALQLLKSNGETQTEWMFHYYGINAEHVRAEARRFGIEEKVTVHGEVQRDEALCAVRGAGVAVVITSVLNPGSLEERGIVTGKVYEAIGLGTPVLAIAPDDSDIDSVLEATAGRRFVGSDVRGIVSYLRNLMATDSSRRNAPAEFDWSALSGRL